MRYPKKKVNFQIEQPEIENITLFPEVVRENLIRQMLELTIQVRIFGT